MSANLNQSKYLAYPYSLSGKGTPATTDEAGHIRDLILQILLTNPGERVNRPNFGAGLQRLLFSPMGSMFAINAEFMITQSLQQMLGDRIDVSGVSVTPGPDFDSEATVEIVYSLKASSTPTTLQIQF